MSNVSGKRIREACEAINNVVATEAGKLQAEGCTTNEVLAVMLTSLSLVSAGVLNLHVEASKGGVPEFVQALARFAQSVADDGMLAYRKPTTPDGSPLQ